jgi:hypothetical protein
MPRLDIDRTAAALARHLRPGSRIPDTQLPDFLLEVLMPLGLLAEARCLGAAIRIGLPDSVRQGQPPTAHQAAAWVERLVSDARLDPADAEDVACLWGRALRLDPLASAVAIRAPVRPGIPWGWLLGGIVLGAAITGCIATLVAVQQQGQMHAAERARNAATADQEAAQRRLVAEHQGQLQHAEDARLDAERRVVAATAAANAAIATQRQAEADRAEAIRSAGKTAADLRDQLTQAQAALQAAAATKQDANTQVEALKKQLAQAKLDQEQALQAAAEDEQRRLDQAAKIVSDLIEHEDQERQERERLLTDAARQANDRAAVLAELLRRDQQMQIYHLRRRGLAQLAVGNDEIRLVALMGQPDSIERTPPQLRYRYGGLTVTVVNGKVTGWQGQL